MSPTTAAATNDEPAKELLPLLCAALIAASERVSFATPGHRCGRSLETHRLEATHVQ